MSAEQQTITNLVEGVIATVIFVGIAVLLMTQMAGSALGCTIENKYTSTVSNFADPGMEIELRQRYMSIQNENSLRTCPERNVNINSNLIGDRQIQQTDNTLKIDSLK